jgi:hypothetical protein
VIDLDARATVRFLEGELEGAELGSEFFVGHAGHDDLAVGEGDVGDGLVALALAGGGVVEAGLGEFGLGELHFGNFASAIDAGEGGHAVCAAAAGDG